jgi:hypothetical protein
MFVTWFRKASQDREKVKQVLVGEENQDILGILLYYFFLFLNE